MKIAYDTIKQNEEIRTYIDMADDNLEQKEFLRLG